jgi:hypothetical protein
MGRHVTEERSGARGGGGGGDAASPAAAAAGGGRGPAAAALDAAIALLAARGFRRADALAALQTSRYDVDAAAELLASENRGT